MADPTISSLLADSAQWLIHEFDFLRKSGTHPGQKGEEIENVLIEFLNEHLPKRFYSSSGHIIDAENNISKQTDVVIYDALASPVYRTSSVSQIVPADTVAAVIEVKSSLNKAELADSYEKIASCKRLKKRSASSTDRAPTGSPLSTLATYGIIFAFDSSTALRTLVENVWELNSAYDSGLWPDLIVVLGKGVIHYQVSFPGDGLLVGAVMPPTEGAFSIPPAYIHLTATEDPDYALNRFFVLLLSHLTFYAHRVSTPPFDVALKGAKMETYLHNSYQYDTDRKLKPIPDDMRNVATTPGLLRMRLFGAGDVSAGELMYVPWQSGAVVAASGRPLRLLLLLLMGPSAQGVVITRSGAHEWSSLLGVTPEEFRAWPDALAKSSDMRGEIV